MRERTKKPAVVIAHSPTPAKDGAAIARLSERLRELEISTFGSYERAAAVLYKVSAYHRFVEETAR